MMAPIHGQDGVVRVPQVKQREVQRDGGGFERSRMRDDMGLDGVPDGVYCASSMVGLSNRALVGRQ